MKWREVHGGRVEYTHNGRWQWSLWLCGVAEDETVRQMLAMGAADWPAEAREAALLAWADSGHEGHELQEVAEVVA